MSTTKCIVTIISTLLGALLAHSELPLTTVSSPGTTLWEANAPAVALLLLVRCELLNYAISCTTATSTL